MDAPQPVRKRKRMVGRRAKAKSLSAGSLAEEIEMLRDSIRKVWELGDDPAEREKWLEILNSLGLACRRLAAVIKTEGELNQHEGGDLLSEYVNEVLPALRSGHLGERPEE